MEVEKSAAQKLVVAEPEDLKKALELGDPAAIKTAPGEDSELDKKADQYVKALLSVNPEDLDKRDMGKASVETMGLDLQKKAAAQSQMLRQPVKNLSKSGEEGGDVANALINLKMKVEDLDPSHLDLEPGWFSRLAGNIPGLGTPLKRYFSRFESAQTVIAAIIRSLENGRDQLKRDNGTLIDDQKRMREMTKQLEKAIKLGQLIDQKLEKEIPGLADEEKKKFVQEELLFPLRQRILDLQQQLAVNQQGVLASEIIIRNNKELVRGVDRALNVTVSALQVAASVAMALANQKMVLDKVTSVGKTTSDLISGTAARLKTQGTEIHKQASSTTLDLEALKSAFSDLNDAMVEISEFRRAALPQMATSILELDKVTAEAEKSIEKVEKGNRSKPQIKIEA